MSILWAENSSNLLLKFLQFSLSKTFKICWKTLQILYKSSLILLWNFLKFIFKFSTSVHITFITQFATPQTLIFSSFSLPLTYTHFALYSDLHFSEYHITSAHVNLRIKCSAVSCQGSHITNSHYTTPPRHSISGLIPFCRVKSHASNYAPITCRKYYKEFIIGDLDELRKLTKSQ